MILVLLTSGNPVILLAQEGDYQKGLSYYKQQQYQKAIGEFEVIVKANPDYESGFRILGDCYLKLMDYDQAAEAFQNALRLKEDNYTSHHGLALAHFNAGRYAETVSPSVRVKGTLHHLVTNISFFAPGDPPITTSRILKGLLPTWEKQPPFSGGIRKTFCSWVLPTTTWEIMRRRIDYSSRPWRWNRMSRQRLFTLPASGTGRASKP